MERHSGGSPRHASTHPRCRQERINKQEGHARRRRRFGGARPSRGRGRIVGRERSVRAWERRRLDGRVHPQRSRDLADRPGLRLAHPGPADSEEAALLRCLGGPLGRSSPASASPPPPPPARPSGRRARQASCRRRGRALGAASDASPRSSATSTCARPSGEARSATAVRRSSFESPPWLSAWVFVSATSFPTANISRSTPGCLRAGGDDRQPCHERRLQDEPPFLGRVVGLGRHGRGSVLSHSGAPQDLAAGGTGIPERLERLDRLLLDGVSLGDRVRDVAALERCRRVVPALGGLRQAGLGGFELLLGDVGGSFLLFERMSTRDLRASTILGRPALISSQLSRASSACFAVAAAATSFARPASAGASARTACSRPWRTCPSTDASDASSACAWSGTHFAASASTPATAASAAFTACSAGASSLAQAGSSTSATRHRIPLTPRPSWPPRDRLSRCGLHGGAQGMRDAAGRS